MNISMRQRLLICWWSFVEDVQSLLLSVSKRQWRSLRWWTLIVSIGVAALVLGFLGFREYYGPGHGHSAFDTAYITWQLFTMESGAVDPPLPRKLELARILAPLAAASAVVKVVLTILRDQIRLLRLATRRGHVVVAGLGRRGIQLCADARQRGYKVVALDAEIPDQLCDDLLDQGITPFQGDASLMETLRRVRVGRAAHVFAVTGNDGVNVEVTLNAHELASDGRTLGEEGSVCHVQVSDFALGKQITEHRVFKETGDAFHIRLISTYENAARVVLAKHPLDYKRISADETRCVRLILLGFGQMGETLAIQAARNGQYANGVPIDVHAFDIAAEERQRSFGVRCPQFPKCGDISFYEGRLEDSDTFASVCALAQSDDAVCSTIALCFDNDSKNVQYGLSLRQVLGNSEIPILARLSDEMGLARLIRDHKEGRIFPFGSLSAASSWPVLMGEETDRMARFIHKRYVEEQLRLGKPEGPNTAPWKLLHHELRDSNRRQADHIPVKLRALGHDVRLAEEAAGLSLDMNEEEVETLARMEHARWNAERFLAGWTLGDKDVEKKRSPYLVPYDELPDDIKEYDRDAVRNIVAIASEAAGQ